MSNVYTAEKDGRYITEVRINGGENVAGRCTEFDPDGGWADLFDVDEGGDFIHSGGDVSYRRYYGDITFVDTRVNPMDDDIQLFSTEGARQHMDNLTVTPFNPRLVIEFFDNINLERYPQLKTIVDRGRELLKDDTNP